LQIRPFTDKNGNKRTAAEVVAESLYFCGDKSNSPAHESGAESPVAAESPADYSDLENLWNKGEPVDDWPLPF
jgi:single-stranded DNA-binding protein